MMISGETCRKRWNEQTCRNELDLKRWEIRRKGIAFSTSATQLMTKNISEEDGKRNSEGKLTIFGQIEIPT